MDIIVGVNGLTGVNALHQGLVRQACDHFIDIHIALGACASLPNRQGELGIKLTGGQSPIEDHAGENSAPGRPWPGAQYRLHSRLS